MKTYTGLQLTFRQCALLFMTLFCLNILMLLGSSLSNELRRVPKSTASKFILHQLNLSVENVLASWYSSMVLLMVALAALVCFFIDRRQKKNFLTGALNFGWIFFCFIFLTLSLDEMGSFHELIGETALFRNLGFGQAQGWNTFLLLIVLVALFMIGFFLSKVRTSKRSFVFMALGTLLFLSNPFQEEFEISTFRSAADPSHWVRPTYLILMEEGSEIFGALCFLTAMVLYAMDRSKQLQLSKDGIHLQLLTTRNKIVRYIGLSALFCFTLMTVLYVNANRILKGDDGIAENWFPCVAFFIVALIAFYKTLDKNPQNKIGYWLLWPFALLYSGYFGSHMYESTLVYKPFFSVFSLHHLLITTSLYIGGYLLIFLRYTISRILMTGFLLLTLTQFFTPLVPVPFIGYASAVLVLGALVMKDLSAQKTFSGKTPVEAPKFSESVLEKSF